jgi:F-type H+-transporting ATPase subunit b
MDVLNKLGIDPIGVVMYLVNFGIIILILAKFVYKPVLNALDKRRELIKNNLEEAEHLKNKFEHDMKARDAESKKMIADMQVQINAARVEAERRAGELILEAEQQKKQMLSEAREQIQALKNSLTQEVEHEIISRMERTVADVLKNKVPKDAIQKSVRESWDELAGVV